MTGGAVCSAALVGMMHTMSGRHAAERVYLSEDSRVILDCNTLLEIVIRLTSHKMWWNGIKHYRIDVQHSLQLDGETR